MNAQQPSRPTQPSAMSSSRLRAWLGLAAVALLVLTFQLADYTYLSAHLPPRRYDVLAPGVPATNQEAAFRLLSLRQTPHWGREPDDTPASPDAGAVWVVAQLEVTSLHPDDYLLCTFTLVGVDGSMWEQDDLGSSAEGESCAPDPEHPEAGAAYPFRVGFQVPEDEADRIAGVALEPYDWHAWQLMRPPV